RRCGFCRLGGFARVRTLGYRRIALLRRDARRSNARVMDRPHQRSHADASPEHERESGSQDDRLAAKDALDRSEIHLASWAVRVTPAIAGRTSFVTRAGSKNLA